jgi:hypothetical protein
MLEQTGYTLVVNSYLQLYDVTTTCTHKITSAKSDASNAIFN